MNKIVATLVIASCALLTACSPADLEPHVDTTQYGTTTVSIPQGHGMITEIRLADGTRCAVLIGSGKGGISCDWQGSSN